MRPCYLASAPQFETVEQRRTTVWLKSTIRGKRRDFSAQFLTVSAPEPLKNLYDEYFQSAWSMNTFYVYLYFSEGRFLRGKWKFYCRLLQLLSYSNASHIMQNASLIFTQGLLLHHVVMPCCGALTRMHLIKLLSHLQCHAKGATGKCRKGDLGAAHQWP